MKIIIIWLFIGPILCAQQRCGKPNTEIYEQYKNRLEDLYQANTFGGKFDDKCMDLGSNYRQRYIGILDSNNIGCTGPWCIDGKFACNRYNDTCYHVEHMVDLSNTPFTGCNINANILGNVIMAYGVWNKQVGQLCWDDVFEEKRKVYGTKVMCDAIANIVDCHKEEHKCKIVMPPVCKESNGDDSDGNGKLIISLIILGVAVGLVIFAAILVCRYVYPVKKDNTIPMFDTELEDITSS